MLKNRVSLLLIFLISHLIFAGESIVLGSLADLSPLSYQKDNGEKDGLFIDIAVEIAERTGMDIEIRLYPFPRLLEYLKTGQVDGILSIYHVPEREEFLIYTHTPVLKSRILVFTEKNENRGYKTIDSLKGSSFGVMSGWSLINKQLEEAVSSGAVKIEEARYYDQNLRKLLAGRVDGLILTEQTTWYHANLMNIADRIKTEELIISESISFMALSRFSPNVDNPEELIRLIDRTLIDMNEDGTYGAMLRKRNLVSMESRID